MNFKRNPDVFFATLDNEICLFNPNEAKYLNLNSTATKIWDFLTEKRSLQEIINHLLTIYEIDKKSCEQETLEFIEIAVNKSILIKIL